MSLKLQRNFAPPTEELPIKFMVFQTLTRNRDVRVRTIVKFLDKDLRHPAELE